MKLHPFFDDPNAVLISRTPVSDPVTWDDFKLGGRQVLTALEMEIEGERPVLKPNLTSGERFPDPETGITTHPAFMWGMIDYLMEHGAQRGECYILEDPRNTNTDECRTWVNTGCLDVAAATGCKLREPLSFQCTRRKVDKPLVRPWVNVATLAVAPDSVFINVPKMKTHNLGITTLNMKNMQGAIWSADRHTCGQAWGCLPPEVRNFDRGGQNMTRAVHEMWQERLAWHHVDFVKAATPHLCVIEGVVGRDGTGFQRGQNYSLGLAVAGRNIVAVDSIGSYLMGFDPQKLVYLKVAAGAGLGPNDLSQIKVYVVRDGRVVPCHDLNAERAPNRFRIFSPVQEDDALTYASID
jgi:uncharacterized protein (DUF362 family)